MGKLENEYIKISEKAKPIKFHETGKKVQNGELKLAYYTTESNVGYFYYLKLK